MKIVIAGASGVVGRSLIPLLTAQGHTVSGTTRDPNKADLLRSLGATPVVVDVYDRGGLFAAVQAARPDAVIHQLTDLTGLDFAATARVRTEGTRNLVDAAQAVGVRRMVTQSFWGVYVPGEGLAGEETPLYVEAPEPWDRVARPIAIMEQTVNELPESVVLRYGLFYGRGTAFDHDGRTAERVRRSKMPANENVVSFLHVEDAAISAQQALAWPAGTYNIADDDPAAASDWLPQYASEIGAPPPPRVTGRDPILSRGVSNQKARREQGWTPRHPSWRAGFVGADPHRPPGRSQSVDAASQG
jgi:nucleoside-diphosphate-sugar epimerase